MSKVTRITDGDDQTEAWMFECPGCQISHAPYTKNLPGKPVWTFNGDADKPTFSPSLLVRWGGVVEGKFSKVCHSFIRDGKIQFLDDCTHALAGQTVEMGEEEP